ncbi:class I SAM-dependent methyltransferase [Flavihumibacter rivuli]|uniref:class I SAM-dependent DNA methyltransferase n=1 Tax=Flavihumibacter rivuli TaxID=2838156 RepID=UPI001BDDFA2E|nr:class I SAM-dependent methyltransferase [Flavihumibacter rivuli]ULQ55864.1 class I SAM-dependent methyltransferase [Flavihumibacter rivuli]
MNTVKAHYDQHLADHYGWMLGNTETRQSAFRLLLNLNAIYPASTRLALDLGAGNGLQSIELARMGFDVMAFDFCEPLLAELRSMAKGLPIATIEANILDFRKQLQRTPELISCCGDTLTHLGSMEEVRQLIADAYEALSEKGSLVLSFRDYAYPLTGTDRFIPVRQDDERILTCFLSYGERKVTVTDLLHLRTEKGWELRVSSYEKLRLLPTDVIYLLEKEGFSVAWFERQQQVINIVGKKG